MQKHLGIKVQPSKVKSCQKGVVNNDERYQSVGEKTTMSDIKVWPKIIYKHNIPFQLHI